VKENPAHGKNVPKRLKADMGGHFGTAKQAGEKVDI
jgi:hypothetical protein